MKLSSGRIPSYNIRRIHSCTHNGKTSKKHVLHQFNSIPSTVGSGTKLELLFPQGLEPRINCKSYYSDNDEAQNQLENIGILLENTHRNTTIGIHILAYDQRSSPHLKRMRTKINQSEGIECITPAPNLPSCSGLNPIDAKLFHSSTKRLKERLLVRSVHLHIRSRSRIRIQRVI